MEGTDFAPAIEALIDAGRLIEGAKKDIEIVPLHDTGEAIKKLVRQGATIETVEFEKTPKPRAIVCSTVESFLDYLNSPHAKDGGIVAVSTRTSANLAVGKHISHDAKLLQNAAPELSALLDAKQPRSQKAFHALLRNYLRDTIMDCDVFISQLASIRVKRTSERGLKINSLGVISGQESKDTLRIVVETDEGEQEFNIGYEWTWTGRWFTCMPNEYSMRCILCTEEHDGQLSFALSLPKFEATKDEVIKDLAKIVRNNVTNPNILVLEATE